jgi:cytochrome-b5 reductase
MSQVYFANEHPQYPMGGVLSQHLERMQIGEKLQMRGPLGKLTYEGHGTFAITGKRATGQEDAEETSGTGGVGRGGAAVSIVRPGVRIVRAKRVGMVCGGTGVTPMLQIVTAVARDATDTTELWLLLANQQEGDVLCKPEIEAALKLCPRLTVNYTLDRPPEGWSGATGFVTASMLRQTMPPPGEDTLILMCGPKPMVEQACKPALAELGYTESQLFTY